MSITAITIRNFRSILSMNERMRELNIFVGQNDEGKSNLLRALDLFFNHNRVGGYRFDWAHDYCSFATKRAGKAEEVEIQLEIVPPPSFSKRTPVLWRKVWRQDGFYAEAMRHSDKTDVSPKSKIAAFLRAMRFDYVPAIKGQDYFQRLMTMLHDMLEATVEEQIRTASGSFTTTINMNAQAILDEIQRRLGLDTTIQLPTNLRDLFAQLEFTSVTGAKPFSLNQRGDGIKVRHIPIVLRWLAEQANHLSERGRPKTVTVWGYEEPENNLELRRCFDLAKEFVEGATTIQAFVTTHSPAFYSVFRTSDQTKVGLFLVTKDTTPPISKIKPLSDVDIAPLDSAMGLLDLLEPHFRTAQQDLNRLQATVRTLTESNKPVLLVEGRSDATILQKAWEVLNPGTPIPYEIVPCGIDPTPEMRDGGAEMLRRCLEFLPVVSDRTILALFDNDRKGNEQFKGVNKRAFDPGIDLLHKKHKTKRAHALLLLVPAGRELFVTAGDIGQSYLSIEHYFSDAILTTHHMKGASILGTGVFEIVGNKIAFAEAAKSFATAEFAPFQILFTRLASFI